MFGRLPREVQKNLARHYDPGEWIINELRSDIMKEIQILETGIHSSGCHDQSPNSDAPAMMTASFHTDTRHHPPQPSSKKPISCIYCKQQHSPSSCNAITSPQDRLVFVKKNNHCFNCLAHPKVTQCTSKYTYVDVENANASTIQVYVPVHHHQSHQEEHLNLQRKM